MGKGDIMNTEELRKAIGSSIRAKRKAAGYKSADGFAKEIGISLSRYYEYEQGRVALPFDVAWTIADALNCTLDAIGGRVPPPRVYEDPKQEALNGYYESMNDGGRDLLVQSAKSISADPERRIVKDRPEVHEDKRQVG